jgi:carbamoyltransferase
VARHIADGKIVGWFQGRMEAGPRALGNRSILADPRNPNAKELLNLRIKRRESFRPFAPSVCEEETHRYFEMPKGKLSPYMVLAGKTRESFRAQLPAVTHIDGTARVHSVSERTNPKFWNLLRAFERLTGLPILLNTSFNESEPIVESPQQAIECFKRTEMDILVIENFVVVKSAI